MIRINVIVKDKTWLKYIKNPDIYLKKKIKKIQRDRFFSNKKYSLSLQLSGEKEIKYLNNKFRKKNKPTDILSFPIKKMINKNFFYLGDIIISYEFMNRPQKINLAEFKKKVAKIFIHGFLHLKGYDHKKDNDFSKMQKEEIKIYNLVKNKI